MEESGVGRHNYGGQWREVWLRGWLLFRCSIGRWEVVGEDLIDAENNIGEEQRGLDRITLSACNTEGAQENGRSHGDADENSIGVANMGELRNAPEEVERARNDGAGQGKEGDLSGVIVSRPFVSNNLISSSMIDKSGDIDRGY